MGCLVLIGGFISINTLIAFVWLLDGGSWDSYVFFITLLWVVFIIFILLYYANSRGKTLRNLNIDSFSDGKKKAEKILGEMKWSPTGSEQYDTSKYVSYRSLNSNKNDFDWVVKYISAEGISSKGDSNNPYAELHIFIGNSIYTCDKVNQEYTVTAIYRTALNDEEKSRIEKYRTEKSRTENTSLVQEQPTVSNVNVLPADYISQPVPYEQKLEETKAEFNNLVKEFYQAELNGKSSGSDHLNKSIVNHKIQRRIKNDPIIKFNLELIALRQKEIDEKTKEFFRIKERLEKGISTSDTESCDFENDEWRETMDELKDEIVELKEEIEDLKEEIEDIKEEIKEDVEDEEWEREMNRM